MEKNINERDTMSNKKGKNHDNVKYDESIHTYHVGGIRTGDVCAWFSLRCVLLPTKATTECLPVRTKPQYESDLNAVTLRRRVIQKNLTSGQT